MKREHEIKIQQGIIPEFSSGSFTHTVSQRPQQVLKTLKLHGITPVGSSAVFLKQVQGATNRINAGFTLIELLVVVLIIGILAAVALPQYQKAVLRSRFNNVWQIAQNLKKGAELYYEQHGEYKDALFGELDIDYSKNCAGEGNAFVCEKGFMFDMNDENVVLIYAPEITKSMTYRELRGSYSNSTSSNKFALTLWFAHSTRPNRIICEGNTNLCQELIKPYVH